MRETEAWEGEIIHPRSPNKSRAEVSVRIRSLVTSVSLLVPGSLTPALAIGTGGTLLDREPEAWALDPDLPCDLGPVSFLLWALASCSLQGEGKLDAF